jgi:hypothetical protein
MFRIFLFRLALYLLQVRQLRQVRQVLQLRQLLLQCANRAKSASYYSARQLR